jgi:hypothetical protein
MTTDRYYGWCVARTGAAQVREAVRRTANAEADSVGKEGAATLTQLPVRTLSCGSLGRRLQHTNRYTTVLTCGFPLPMARERRASGPMTGSWTSVLCGSHR